MGLFNFQFITKSKKTKKAKPMVRVKLDHAPIEIYNMDDYKLHELYEHGSVAERDIAYDILKRRKNFATATMASEDDPIPIGAQYNNTIKPETR